MALDADPNLAVKERIRAAERITRSQAAALRSVIEAFTAFANASAS